jgi:FAD/FMN-containing dehydrogenase
MKGALPPWILFYNVAGYDYFPEDRVKGQIADIQELAQKIGLQLGQSRGGVSAFELLKMAQGPSPEPYWKAPAGWSCQDIFFICQFQKVGELIDFMYDIANKAGYNTPNMGVYIQPVVQGVNYHVEFNLFYQPPERETVRKLSVNAVRKLIDKGAFFSRPYGESVPIVMNRDAATVAALKKVKAILDPNNIMNPGKLCF